MSPTGSNPFIAAPRSPETRALVAKMRAGEFGQNDLPTLYDLVREAHPSSYRPPYIAEPHGVVPGLLRGPLRAVASKVGPAGRTFQKAFTPDPTTHVVYKEVDMAATFDSICSTSLPLAYIVRHPCAVVRSRLKGQEDGVMNLAGRRKNLEAVISESAHLIDDFGDRLDDLTPLQAEALIWRADVERCVAAVARSDHADLFFYEDLVDGPMVGAEVLLATLGLTMAPQVADFVRASSQGASFRQRLAYGEIGRKKYFSVFQDPAVSRDSWKSQMTSDEKAQVVDVVRSAPAFQTGLDRGCWTES